MEPLEGLALFLFNVVLRASQLQASSFELPNPAEMPSGSNERKAWLLAAVAKQQARATASDSATDCTNPRVGSNRLSQRAQWLAASQPRATRTAEANGWEPEQQGSAARNVMPSIVIDITKGKIEMEMMARAQKTIMVKRRTYRMVKKRGKVLNCAKLKKPVQLGIHKGRGEESRIQTLLTSGQCCCCSGTCWSSLSSRTSEVVELVQAFNRAPHSVQNKVLWSGVNSKSNLKVSSVQYRVLNCTWSMPPRCFARLFAVSRTRCARANKVGCLDGRAFIVHRQPRLDHCTRWLLGQYCTLAEALPDRLHRDWGLKKPLPLRLQRAVGGPNAAAEADPEDSEDEEMLKWQAVGEEEKPLDLTVQNQELDKLIWQVVNSDTSLWARFCVHPDDLPKRYCALLLCNHVYNYSEVSCHSNTYEYSPNSVKPRACSKLNVISLSLY